MWGEGKFIFAHIQEFIFVRLFMFFGVIVVI